MVARGVGEVDRATSLPNEALDELVVDPGDVIVTENPTFLGALIAFAPTEPAYAPVRTDADGMDTEHLEEVLEANPNATMLYTVPDFQNPTGVTLSSERRRRLIELANEHELLVVEDTPYRALRYEGESLPTLKSLDTEGRVLHLGSFSKSLAPGPGRAGVGASTGFAPPSAPSRRATRSCRLRDRRSATTWRRREDEYPRGNTWRESPTATSFRTCPFA